MLFASTMDSIHNIGTNIGRENISQEFKQVVIPRAIWDTFDDTCIMDRIMTPNIDNAIYQTISGYFDKYLPRYVASMSRTPGKTASLMFGVDDNGTILGFPTLNGIESTDIIAMIISTLGNMRGVRNGTECENVKKKYIREIKVKVKDLHPPAEPASIDDIIKNSIQHEITYRRAMAKYHTAMADWRAQRFLCAQPLETICNDPTHRKAFLMYCEQHFAPEPIISKLKSNDDINFKIGTVLTRKNDKTTIEYWITEFKEHYWRSQSNCRPERPNVKRFDNYLKIHLSRLEIMNGNWKNQVRYQMIEVIMRMNDDPTEWIEYRKGDYWVSSIRTTSAVGDPCCEETFDCGMDDL